jgi:putative membrane protein
MTASLLAFSESFAAALALLAAFLAAYTLLLPLKEWALIRQGNTAAALVLAGAVVGFCLPLAEAIRQSNGLSDMIVWAGISLAGQLLAFGVLRLWRKDAAAAIERGDMAEAITLATFSVVLGMLNAACLS